MVESDLDDVSPVAERVPVVLLVDRSESMMRECCTSHQNFQSKIEFVEEKLNTLTQNKDLLQPTRNIDVSVINVTGDVEGEHQFIPLQEWSPPTPTADRHAINEGVMRAVKLGEDYKDECRNRGVPHCSPHLFLFSDGETISTKLDDEVFKTLAKGLKENHIRAFVCVKVPGSEGTNALDGLIDIDSDASINSHTVSIQDFQFEEWINPLDHARPVVPSKPCPHCNTDLYDYVDTDVDSDPVDLKFCPSCGNEIEDISLSINTNVYDSNSSIK